VTKELTVVQPLEQKEEANDVGGPGKEKLLEEAKQELPE
jgi:hypothetical protein